MANQPRTNRRRTRGTVPQVPSRAVAGGARSATRAARVPARGLLFSGLCAVCLALAGGYAGVAALRTGSARTAAPPAGVDTAAARALAGQARLVFLSTAIGDDYGSVSVVPLASAGGARAGTALTCQRVYFAAGRGLCLGNYRVGGFMSRYTASIFDESFTPTATFQQLGIPSRVRVSPDGRLGAITVFITGHSYADKGFSTATTLVDLSVGQPIGNLEEFGVTRDGSPFQSPDFNFWGVTFAADGDHFYATLRTAGQHYLVEGDVAERKMRVVGEDVECPSLSPDNTRIVFKRQVGSNDRPAWQLYVRDLLSRDERPLSAEWRSVDDQVEWLDNGSILYALTEEGPPQSTATSIWALAIDGTNPPTVFLPQGYSPSVVHE